MGNPADGIAGAGAGSIPGGSTASAGLGGSSAAVGAGGLGASGAPASGGMGGANATVAGGGVGIAGAGGARAGSGGVGGASGGGASSSAGAGGGDDPGNAPFKGVAGSQDGLAITPCAARALLKVSWYYNWTQSDGTACANGQGGAFVPMIWGHANNEQSVAGITQAISGLVTKGHKYVLGFNEPNKSDQSNIAVPLAISLLPGFDNPGITVGTPATSADAAGQTWFKDYMAQVNANTSLRGDFIAIHWYGWNAGSCDASASQLESYIKYAEGFAGNRPIWLTEWSCLNSSAATPEGVLAFYQGALSVFAKHPRVQRYAWYPFTTNCELNNADGSLTPLGVAYAAAPATK